MMKLFATLSILGFVAAKSVRIDEVEFGFCDGSPTPGSFDMVNVQPFPISFKTGASLSVGFQVTISEALPVGATVTLDLKKEGLIPLPIPCLEIPDGNGGILHLGSCTYDADYLLDLFSEQLCPAAVPDGQTCNLPLNPGVYGADPFLEVTIPDIPDILVELVGAGTYYLGANVNLEDGNLYSCLFARVEVVA